MKLLFFIILFFLFYIKNSISFYITSLNIIQKNIITYNNKPSILTSSIITSFSSSSSNNIINNSFIISSSKKSSLNLLNKKNNIIINNNIKNSNYIFNIIKNYIINIKNDLKYCISYILYGKTLQERFNRLIIVMLDHILVSISFFLLLFIIYYKSIKSDEE